MKQTITRRDFLNGAALALAAGATFSPRELLALEQAPLTAAGATVGLAKDYYPPALTGMRGAQGFDAERDIAAITVNRRSHGYSYAYSQLYDPEWEEGQAPHELGRVPIGRIHIANCDSEASASLHAAIDAAARAVGEIKKDEAG